MKDTLGRRGEDLAASYLRERGYQIVRRNFRYGRREIDIIARRDGVTVFVEVKTRSSDRFGSPGEAVDTRKLGVLRKVALAYLTRHGAADRPCRFDLIGIRLRDGDYTIDHTEDIFS